MPNVRRVLAKPGSDVYHGVRGGRVKCGGTSYDHDHVISIEEANEDPDLSPCGNCWRSRSLLERVAAIGVDDGGA